MKSLIKGYGREKGLGYTDLAYLPRMSNSYLSSTVRLHGAMVN
jgi:hypothetical protein